MSTPSRRMLPLRRCIRPVILYGCAGKSDQPTHCAAAARLRPCRPKRRSAFESAVVPITPSRLTVSLPMFSTVELRPTPAAVHSTFPRPVNAALGTLVGPDKRDRGEELAQLSV